jgi:hypothetical protein
MTDTTTIEPHLTVGVPAEARTLPPRDAVPVDLPEVMAEQARLGTQVVGPPLTGTEA